MQPTTSSTCEPSLAAPLPTAVFRTRDALRLGLTPGALRGPRFAAPTSGVRVDAADDLDLVERCRAVNLVLGRATAFSHVTALRLLGVEVPWRLADDDRLHVTAPRRVERVRRSGVVAHYTAHDVQVVQRDGLTIVHPAQVWLQLACSLPPDDVVVLADAMLRRKDPVTVPQDFRDVLRRTYRTRGIVRAREAVDLLRPGTDSSMETRARLLVVQAGMPCPRVNVPCVDAAGRFLALADMSYPELRVAIEYDGDVHRTDPATWRRDVERRQRLEDAGWIVVTATADDVIRFPDRFVGRVRAARARARAARR